MMGTRQLKKVLFDVNFDVNVLWLFYNKRILIFTMENSIAKKIMKTREILHHINGQKKTPLISIACNNSWFS